MVDGLETEGIAAVFDSTADAPHSKDTQGLALGVVAEFNPLLEIPCAQREDRGI